MKSYKIFIGLAALFGLTAVVIGALSAHAVERGLSAEAISRIDTALKYQFYHLAALLSVGVLSSLHRNFDSLMLKLSGLAFIIGILLFSGSLYAYAITGNELFGKVTPFGGLSLILGWLFLFFFSFKK
ncbi:MAG: uncharacterized membrane protein YgdD (TMEM256/DUF423 family) [Cocleimonas sp.]|jgi:uncharacterized membrane protein YgdD (TMEM256/DUF423 family)